MGDQGSGMMVTDSIDVDAHDDGMEMDHGW